jgi:lipocalin-like protein
MRLTTLIIAIVAVAAAQSVSGQEGGGLVGTWRLVSVTTSSTDGATNDSVFGSNPSGLLTYTPDGRMSAVISYGGRTPLSGDRTSAPANERADAFNTFLAYAGRYTTAGDRVTHHVEVASFQNWVNTDLIRTVRHDRDRITLRTPPTSVGGVTRTTELVWERVK